MGGSVIWDDPWTVATTNNYVFIDYGVPSCPYFFCKIRRHLLRSVWFLDMVLSYPAKIFMFHENQCLEDVFSYWNSPFLRGHSFIFGGVCPAMSSHPFLGVVYQPQGRPELTPIMDRKAVPTHAHMMYIYICMYTYCTLYHMCVSHDFVCIFGWSYTIIYVVDKVFCYSKGESLMTFIFLTSQRVTIPCGQRLVKTRALELK